MTCVLLFALAAEPIPLVLVRSFESHREGYCELLEEFRLFHNLYQETRTGKYFKVDDNGDEEEIARVEPNKVEAKLRAVRQFCAVKGMHLAVYFELDRYSQHWGSAESLRAALKWKLRHSHFE